MKKERPFRSKKNKLILVFLIVLLLFFLFAFYVDREHLKIDKELNNSDWTETNFINRFLKRKWQKVEINSKGEVILHNIDSSLFPKWFAKVNFTPIKKNATHFISYYFKQNCTAGKEYPSGEISYDGSKISFICTPNNFIKYSYDGSGKNGLGVNIGEYEGNFRIDDKTKYLIQRTGKLNASINEISCF